MRMTTVLFLSLSLLLQMGCSPVKTIVRNQYQLSAFSAKHFSTKPRHATLLVTPPDAVAGYQTEQMLYIKTPFKVEGFANNAWTNPPADMMYPLIVQSLQHSGYFYAVASSPYSDPGDYRLDTQLLRLQQNFLRKPSVLELSAKVVLTRVTDNRVMASRIISLQLPCPTGTPYGGVLAANQAMQQFTAATTDFVMKGVAKK